MSVEFVNVTFGYDDAGEPVFEGLELEFGPGWTGVVGANGSGKTTLLTLVTGELRPTSGTVKVPGSVLCCEQRTDQAPAGLGAFLGADDRSANRLRGQLEVESDWLDRWHTLSHGERKRAQLAVVLWQRPDVLLLDEPTNHVDAHARTLLFEALKAFRGIGLLVSHDRQLLDDLCSACLFLMPPDSLVRPGGYSKARAELERERRSSRRARSNVERTLRTIQREVGVRRREAARADRRRSKRGLSPGDSDAREKLDRARVSGKDGTAGRLTRQMQGRLRQAQAELDALPQFAGEKRGIWMPGTRARKSHLVTLPAGRLTLASDCWLEHPALRVKPDDRIALTGNNGTGKSSLVRHLLRQADLPPGRVLYLPQELDMGESSRILHDVRSRPHQELGQVLSIVGRLGSSPSRLLDTSAPSPGELRKLLLALGVLREPYLVVLDEPTNHLDLAAIESLGEALEDCPCAMVLVSHDLAFLRRLARDRWHIAGDTLAIGSM